MKTIIATTTLVALFGLERARAAGGHLKENNHCWPAGGDMLTRDAACAGDMVCARRGFNERQWGGCTHRDTAGPPYVRHCCTKPPKYTFTLRGSTGEEQVMINGEKFTLSTEDVEFGSESRVEMVEFTNDGLSSKKRDKNVFVDNTAASIRAGSGTVLGNWNGNWKCEPYGNTASNERCGYVRAGRLMWNGGYVLAFDDEGDSTGDSMIPMNDFTCKASSEYSSAFSCKNAIDGNLKSDWATRGQGTGASYTLNLGAIFTIDTLTLQHRSGGHAKEQERFKDIRLSFDDGSSKTATLTNSQDFQDIEVASATTQYIKITVLSVHNPRGFNNHGLSEIIVFGTKTVPFTKCPAGFRTKTNFDYHGNDLTNGCGKGLTIAEAQRECLNNEACKGFSVLTEFNTLLMRNGAKLYQPWCLKKALTNPRLRSDHSFCVKENCRKNIDIGRHFKVESNAVNGRCTDMITVQAGQPVMFEANWFNREAGCKGCIEQLYFGIKGTPMKCLYSRNMGSDWRGTYKKTYTFDTPGTYEIHAASTWQMRCNNNIQRGVRIVTVIVK